jgi:hypothetical protein
MKSLSNNDLKREKARIFLRKEVAPNYKTFSNFEEYVRDYKGPFEEYLSEVSEVLEYLRKRNSGGSSRIFGIGNSEIEDILNNTISPKDS